MISLLVKGGDVASNGSDLPSYGSGEYVDDELGSNSWSMSGISYDGCVSDTSANTRSTDTFGNSVPVLDEMITHDGGLSSGSVSVSNVSDDTVHTNNDGDDVSIKNIDAKLTTVVTPKTEFGTGAHMHTTGSSMHLTDDADFVFLYKTCRRMDKKTRRTFSRHLTGTSRNYQGASRIANPFAIIIQKYVRRFLTKVRITTTTTHAIRRFRHFTFNLHPERTPRNTEKDWGATTALLILERQHNPAPCTVCYYYVVRDWQLIDLLVREFGDKVGIISGGYVVWAYSRDNNSDRFRFGMPRCVDTIILGLLYGTHSVSCRSLSPTIGFNSDCVLPSSGSSIPLFAYGRDTTVHFTTFGIEDGEILDSGEKAWRVTDVNRAGWKEDHGIGSYTNTLHTIVVLELSSYREQDHGKPTIFIVCLSLDSLGQDYFPRLRSRFHVMIFPSDEVARCTVYMYESTDMNQLHTRGAIATHNQGYACMLARINFNVSLFGVCFELEIVPVKSSNIKQLDGQMSKIHGELLINKNLISMTSLIRLGSTHRIMNHDIDTASNRRHSSHTNDLTPLTHKGLYCRAR